MSLPYRPALTSPPLTHGAPQAHALIHAQAPLTHILAPGPGEQMEVSGLRVSTPSLRQEEGMVQG